MSPAPELTEKDYHYCVVKGCPHKVAKISSLLDKCPNDGSTEYTTWERKKAIEKGVVSAQAARVPKLPAGATETDDGTGKGDTTGKVDAT